MSAQDTNARAYWVCHATPWEGTQAFSREPLSWQEALLPPHGGDTPTLDPEDPGGSEALRRRLHTVLPAPTMQTKGRTMVSDKQRIKATLDQMSEETGVQWRGPFTCCQTCGHYKLQQELGAEADYVFWDEQSHERAFQEDQLLRGLILYHSGSGAAAAVSFLSTSGFFIEWDGSSETSVAVWSSKDLRDFFEALD